MRRRLQQLIGGGMMGRERLRALLALAFALALAASLAGGRVAGVEPVGVAPPGTVTSATDITGARVVRAPLTGDAVTASFRASRLPMNDLRQEATTQRGPSGAPATEREAWAFRVPGAEPSGGRIFVFADDAALQQKADWFRRVGAGSYITIHGNVILWLDPDIAASEATRYRAALTRL